MKSKKYLKLTHFAIISTTFFTFSMQKKYKLIKKYWWKNIVIQIYKKGFILKTVLVALTIILAGISIKKMVDANSDIYDAKEEYKKIIKNEYNGLIDGSVQKINEEIGKLNSDIARKNDEISELNKINKKLNNEILEIESDLDFLENNHIILPNILIETPMFGSVNFLQREKESYSKIFDFKSKELNDLYGIYDDYKICWFENKNSRKKVIDKINYNYDDKNFWNEIINNVSEVQFNSAFNLFDS